MENCKKCIIWKKCTIQHNTTSETAIAIKKFAKNKMLLESENRVFFCFFNENGKKNIFNIVSFHFDTPTFSCHLKY
jgi:hypothetical protein